MPTTPHNPYHTIGIPDARLMARLGEQVRAGGNVTPFIRAGQALASVIIGSREAGELPSWVGSLADALGSTLAIVARRTQAHESADLRIELATTAVALSVVRPDLADVCHDAITTWLTDGATGALHHHRPHLLAARTLHHLLLDHTQQASATVEALLTFEGATAGSVLYDWTVSRAQHHGVNREAQCFHYLRLALASSDPACARAGLQLLAAAAIVRRSGHPLSYVLPWLHTVACDIEQVGTSSLSAAG